MSQGWTLTGADLSSFERIALQELKTVSSLNKDKWISLARHYKRIGQLDKCEIAYLGARYADINDKDLMREWLAVYTLNRGAASSKEDLLASANMINRGLFDVVADPLRVLNEVQHLLFALENPAARG